MDACRRNGLRGGIWQTIPDPYRAYTGVDFYVAEAERKTDWRAFVTEFRKRNPTIRSATITNLDNWGIEGYFNPLIEDGWACITECYVSDNPNATPERMAFTARQRGWFSSQPCVSIYPGRNADPKVSDYDLSGWGGWSVYLAEYL